MQGDSEDDMERRNHGSRHLRRADGISISELRERGHRLDWNAFAVHGPDEPYATLSDVEVVYLVSAGGIGDRIGNTGLNPVCLAVFADEPSARAYAESTHDPLIDVRTVPLGVLLPPH